MIFTKTFIWLQIFWSLTPTIRELDAGVEGITKKKYLFKQPSHKMWLFRSFLERNLWNKRFLKVLLHD